MTIEFEFEFCTCLKVIIVIMFIVNVILQSYPTEYISSYLYNICNMYYNLKCVNCIYAGTVACTCVFAYNLYAFVFVINDWCSLIFTYMYMYTILCIISLCPFIHYLLYIIVYIICTIWSYANYYYDTYFIAMTVSLSMALHKHNSTINKCRITTTTRAITIKWPYTSIGCIYTKKTYCGGYCCALLVCEHEIFTAALLCISLHNKKSYNSILHYFFKHLCTIMIYRYCNLTFFYHIMVSIINAFYLIMYQSETQHIYMYNNIYYVLYFFYLFQLHLNLIFVCFNCHDGG